MVNRPEILLCDEATSALDPETTLSILQLLKDINRRLGLTIVLITHEMRAIREICDQVLVLERGEIAESGAVWEVFGNPQHDATRALLAPLTRGPPEDLAAAIRVERSENGASRAIVELVFTGADGLGPNLTQLGEVFGPGTRLIQSNLDRIQGHVGGRLLLSVLHHGRSLEQIEESLPASLAGHIRIAGYVASDD